MQFSMVQFQYNQRKVGDRGVYNSVKKWGGGEGEGVPTSNGLKK